MASSLRRAVTATMLCLFVLAISCGRFGLYKDVYGDSDVSMDADVEVNDDADMDAERENDADVESEAGVDADVPLSAPVHIASISFQLVALEEPEFSVADIAVSDAGDVLLVGAFSGTASFGGPSHVSNGNEDCFVASFTDDLIYQWSESYGGSSSDHMTSVDVTAAARSG